MGYDYKALLRDRRWQKKRLEVLEAAGWECEYCGDKNNSNLLHVHHKKYRRGAKPWEYELEELASLCEGCHDDMTLIFSKLSEAVETVKFEMDTSLAAYVTGYINADSRPNSPVSVLSYEHADGIGHRIGVSAESVIEEVDENNCVVPVDVMFKKKCIKLE